jgi:hypothetical protein
LANTTIEERSYTSSLLFFDRKIEAATAGLPSEYSNYFTKYQKIML